MKYDHSVVKLFHREGFNVEFKVGDFPWVSCSPMWAVKTEYRVVDYPEIESTPIVEGQVNKTIGGLGCVDWIRNKRATDGSSLKEAKDAWDRLIAEKMSDQDIPVDGSEGYLCKIIEVDIEKDILSVSMTNRNYIVGPGMYRLVRIN